MNENFLRVRDPYSTKMQLVPLLGMAAFAFLYFYAASIYPGGTRTNPASIGYSHLHNFWCDLLDNMTYSGAPNPARPFAIAATILLPVSLLPFWFFVPTLFSPNRQAGIIVRLSGMLSMLIAATLPLAHDAALDGSCTLLFVACAVTFISLYRNREFRILGFATIALAVSSVNFVMWKTGYRLDLMPMVQKTAIAASCLCLVVATLRIRRLDRLRTE